MPVEMARVTALRNVSAFGPEDVTMSANVIRRVMRL